jgi:phosphoglycolate phosphatase-like HAD superfamily hydrolase
MVYSTIKLLKKDMDFSKTKAIFFDFDGVIVESLQLKLGAFETLFAPYGEEVVQRVKTHTLLHGGISRKEKIPFYFKEYIGQPLTESESAQYCEEYSTLVKDAVIKTPLVTGVEEFLFTYMKEITLAVITGTPQEEIDYIISNLSIKKYFSNVCGSPEHKDSIINRLLASYNLKAEEALMIGDSITDYDAAVKTGVPFLLRYTEESAEHFAKITVPQFRDFRELLASQEPDTKRAATL